MRKINICIVDDHPLILEGVEKVLKTYDHINITGTCGSGNALLQLISEMPPDIILMDMQLPDYTDGELLTILKKKFEKIPVIVLTNEDNPYMVKSMLVKGCSGYVLKTAGNHVLVAAIEQVFEQQVFIDPVIKNRFADFFIGSETGVKNQWADVILTNREKEILVLIGEGLTTTEISAKLFLSNRTIENHRFSICKKFGVNNIARLIKVALQKGYLS